MRVSLIPFFIGVAYAFLRDIEFAEESSDFFPRGAKYLNNYHKSLHNPYEDLSESPFKDEQDISKLTTVFQSLILANTSINDDIPILNLSGYIKGPEDMDGCIKMSSTYCSFVESIGGNSSDAKDLKDMCKDKSELCKLILLYLNETCIITKNKLNETIGQFSKDNCTQLLKECLNMETCCGTILNSTCTEIKEKCKNSSSTTPTQNTTVPEPSSSGTVDETMVETVITIPAETYTGTGTIVTYVTTDVTVNASEPETVLESATTTITLCECTCPPGACTHESTSCDHESTSMSSDEPSSSESTPEPTPEPTDSVEPDEPKQTDSTKEDCTVMETVTVTADSTKSSNKGDKTNTRSGGIRLKGLHKEGFICMIISMLIGIWVVA
ncbi:hypothetical protein PORY_000758 [Pneumocystis oryctolagi]|uniref:Uncharacterized protein n=1 Tax=Pneumocystis oryctolagi TaxID=42067 RepID=A0ACB7CE37_9ASCO|nr:hypothetical protein PORY_000758 [Pneumocystis oryctolagi]